jgi:hypothetical protein
MKPAWIISIAVVILMLMASAFIVWRTFWAARPAVAPVIEATQVVRYIPSAQLPADIKDGSCFANSVAAPYRADAWRCTVGNEINDPCFESSEKDILVCGANPAMGEAGFQLKSTKPLPAASVAKPSAYNWAWLVLLNDGTYCTPFTGTRPFTATGDVAIYSCKAANPGEDMIFGDLDTSKNIWTAKVGALSTDGAYPPSIRSSAELSVKTVWQ